MLWHFLVTWIATTISLLVLSRLPIGLELKDAGTALVAALVLGLLNAFVRPVLAFFTFPITLLTLGLFSFVISAAMLWLTSGLVKGVRLSGCLSALVSAVLLALLNAILLAILT
ncbi:MAG TPA: phage holin family protein [Caldilineaceae bacterium]|nr:phage holin family protein [Caldilineaceae bacterium]